MIGAEAALWCLLWQVHGSTSEMYLMLRQAMLARRALLLIDGLDEGGKVRNEIERHVTEVLAPQVRSHHS